MGTFTAQILVGDPHPNHQGIAPTHNLFLSENDRPAWILSPIDVSGEAEVGHRRITWIPTVEHMLEDALFMIAVHVCGHGEILEFGRELCSNIESELLELNSDFSQWEREEIYNRCRKIATFPKLIVSVFKGSAIAWQLPVLESYKMDIEVCSPIYSRLYSPWTNATAVEGSLSDPLPEKRMSH
jgi:hypothetical protein